MLTLYSRRDQTVALEPYAALFIRQRGSRKHINRFLFLRMNLNIKNLWHGKSTPG
jgi:hypothetical protein